MNESIDRDEAIFALAEGVGSILGRAIRQSYYVQLERMEKRKEYQRYSPQERQAFVKSVKSVKWGTVIGK